MSETIKPQPLSPEQRERIEQTFEAACGNAFFRPWRTGDIEALLSHIAYLEEENARLARQVGEWIAKEARWNAKLDGIMADLSKLEIALLKPHQKGIKG
jgi:hypothetical protein